MQLAETEDDQPIVYRRIHINLIKHLNNYKNLDFIPENVFNEPMKKWDEKKLENWNNLKDGVSVDCAKLTTEEQTIIRENKERRKHGIIKMKVYEIEKIPPLTVKLNPIVNHPVYEDNPAHSLIFGITLENKEYIRVDLAKKEVSEWGLRGWND